MPALLHPPTPNASSAHLRWHQLYGSAAALALAEATRADQRLYVLIADDARELERLAAELRFFGGDQRLRCCRCRTGKCCRTTCSRRIRTSSPSACRRSSSCRSAAARLPDRGRRHAAAAAAAAQLRAGPRLRARSAARRSRSSRSASAWRRPATPASARWRARASSRCAARCSMCSRWARRRRCASTCSTTEIEAIRRFDPETQRSLDALEQLRLLPAREVPLDAEAVKDFRRRYRTRFEGDPHAHDASIAASARASRRRASSSICRCSSRRPRRSSTTCPRDAVIVHDAALAAALRARPGRTSAHRYEDRRHDIERPLLAPAEAVPRAARSSTRSARGRSQHHPRALQGRHRTAAAADAARNFPTTAPPRAAHRCARRAAARAARRVPGELRRAAC